MQLILEIDSKTQVHSRDTKITCYMQILEFWNWRLFSPTLVFDRKWKPENTRSYLLQITYELVKLEQVT